MKMRKKYSSKCSQCDYKTDNSSQLKRHVNEVHSRKRPFKCVLCDHTATRREFLKKHIDAVHCDKRPFQCDQCDYKAAYKSALKVHVDVVHLNKLPFKCAKCSFAASQKSDLKKHENAIHLGLKPFKCNVPNCTYETSWRHNFRSHLKTHTNDYKTKIMSITSSIAASLSSSLTKESSTTPAGDEADTSGQAVVSESTSFAGPPDPNAPAGQENKDYTRITLSQSIQPFTDVLEKKKESVSESYKLVEQRVLASFQLIQAELDKRKAQLIEQAKADLDAQLKLIATQEKSAIATETPKVQRRTSSRRKAKKLNESEPVPATIDRIHPDLFVHNELTFEDSAMVDLMAEIRKFGQIEVKKKTLDNNQFITSNQNDKNTAINREITTPPTNLPTSENTTTVALVTLTMDEEPESVKETGAVQMTNAATAVVAEPVVSGNQDQSSKPTEASKAPPVVAEAVKMTTGGAKDRPVASRPAGQYIINIPFQSVIAFSPFATDAYNNNVEMFEASETT